MHLLMVWLGRVILHIVVNVNTTTTVVHVTVIIVEHWLRHNIGASCAIPTGVAIRYAEVTITVTRVTVVRWLGHKIGSSGTVPTCGSPLSTCI